MNLPPRPAPPSSQKMPAAAATEVLQSPIQPAAPVAAITTPVSPPHAPSPHVETPGPRDPSSHDSAPLAGAPSVREDPAAEPPPADPPVSVRRDPLLGTTVDGRYAIESILGEGGMGIVYAGRHKVIDKRIAMKVLRSDLSRDREMTDRFLREARAASSIGHPHIVDVSDFGVLPDGSAFFVMEFLEGASLSHVMTRDAPIPQKRMLHIVKQVADALDAAHKKDIVHRDLKPDNVFLMSRGLEKDFAKILDFGIAKVTTNTAKLTRAGTVFGTPHYMSPEQAAGAPVDLRTDIYSLGVIMYEIAAGKVPFDADNYMGILTQHMYKAPVPLRALVPAPNSNVAPGVEAIILKCLSKKPEQRYESMHALIEDIDLIERGELPGAVAEMMARSGAFNVPVDYFASPAVRPSVLPAEPASRRKPWGLIAGGAGVLAAIGIVATILSRSSSGGATTPPASLATPPPSQAAAAPTATTTATVTTTVTATASAAPPPSASAAPASKPVIVNAIPLDAEVFRDGESLGKVPVNVQVTPGSPVSVELRRNGYASQTVSVDGASPKVDVKLIALGKGGKGTFPPKKGGAGDIADPYANH